MHVCGNTKTSKALSFKKKEKEYFVTLYSDLFSYPANQKYPISSYYI